MDYSNEIVKKPKNIEQILSFLSNILEQCVKISENMDKIGLLTSLSITTSHVPDYGEWQFTYVLYKRLIGLHKISTWHWQFLEK